MTNKPFEINGLGTCLVGTYTIRHLTKYFKCLPNQLLFISIEPGVQYEFYSYLLKYSRENAIIQQQGLDKFKEIRVEEIDLILDEFPLSDADNEKLADALYVNLLGMTAKEFAEKIKGTEEEAKEPKEIKKKVIGSSIGEESTNLLGVTE